jgi:multiple sugar transport system ATP-binding protein
VAAIEFRGVGKRYEDGTTAVRDLDLRIDDGEFMILVGPSGCGKSTALRMVAGLEEVTDGEVLIDDEVVNDEPPKDRDVAMVFQNYALYANMTVRDNMAFALRVQKVPRAQIDERVEAAAKVLDLVDHLDRKPGKLSGGQRQRVAMGRAIVREPRAFLMDEPLSNLDAKLRVQMRTEIARLQSRTSTTTVYVTHDQTEAMTLGHRVAVMRHGLLQQVGTPDELYERPANVFVAGFIGSPPMNFLPAEADGTGLHTPLGDLPVRTPELRHALDAARGRAVVAGVRPEDLADVPPVGAEDDGASVPVRVPLDVVERLGSESLAYFTIDQAVDLPELAEIAEDPAGGSVDLTRGQLVARLDGRSRMRPGDVAELHLAIDRLHLFDRETGAALT